MFGMPYQVAAYAGEEDLLLEVRVEYVCQGAAARNSLAGSIPGSRAGSAPGSPVRLKHSMHMFHSSKNPTGRLTFYVYVECWYRLMSRM